jgi:hypothetical protein
MADDVRTDVVMTVDDVDDVDDAIVVLIDEVAPAPFGGNNGVRGS